MDSQLPSETGYVPTATTAPSEAPHRAIFQRRWPKVAGAVGALTLTAALGLQFSHVGHTTTVPTAKVATTTTRVITAQSNASQHGAFHFAATGTGVGGLHGSFSLYDGLGGGVEFWFNPSTGLITIAVGAGVGVGGSGSISYYTPGTVPAAGLYDYANVTFGAGTFGSVTASGSYSYSSNSFSGSASATVDGRTVTINSDGTGGLSVNVTPSVGASGFTGNAGVKYVFDFTAADVEQIFLDIWNDITSAISDYLNDLNDILIEDDYEGDDVSGSSTSVGTDSIGDEGSSDDSGSDASGDTGGGGGGGTTDDAVDGGDHDEE